MGTVVEGLDEIVAPVETAVETVTETPPSDFIEEIVETVEDGAETIEIPAEPELPAEEPAEIVDTP